MAYSLSQLNSSHESWIPSKKLKTVGTFLGPMDISTCVTMNRSELRKIKKYPLQSSGKLKVRNKRLFHTEHQSFLTNQTMSDMQLRLITMGFLKAIGVSHKKAKSFICTCSTSSEEKNHQTCSAKCGIRDRKKH